MTSTPASKSTPAVYLQAILSFGIALAVVIIGEVYLPVPGWTRAFLGLGTVFLVSSAFTLAKCVRDQQDTETVVSRIDQARLERMLAEYDPYRVPSLGEPGGAAPRSQTPGAPVAQAS